MGIIALVYRSQGKTRMVSEKKFSFFYLIIFLFFCVDAIAQNEIAVGEIVTHGEAVIGEPAIAPVLPTEILPLENLELVEALPTEALPLAEVLPSEALPPAEEVVSEVISEVLPEALPEALPLAETFPVETNTPETVTAETNIQNNNIVETATNIETVANNEVARATGMELGKTENNSGFVLISLEGSSPFKLSRTAPSEYILNLPGVQTDSNSESLNSPLIAPRGIPGIRSVRATKSEDGLSIRMFVDANVDLQAYPRGNEILVESIQSNFSKDPNARTQLARDPNARAQLAEEEPEKEKAANADLGEDSTARSNPTGIRSADGSKIYTGRLISLDLQDTDIDNALRIIAEVSNLNIIASDDVSGKVTLRLIDVPWDQALDVILKTNGLDQVAEGNVIRIAPVDKLRQEREALREAKKAAEALEDLTVQYVRVSYARVGELVDQVQGVLSERGTVVEDERTNQLIVRDIKKGHEQAIDLIKKLDLRTPQVLLETQIVEGSRNLTRDLGFQLGGTLNRGPSTGNATGLNFPNTINISGDATGGNFANFPAADGGAIAAILGSADGARALNARLSALENEGRIRIVSRPQIATINNKTAEIKSVETLRVKLPSNGTSVATGSGATAAGGGQAAFEEIDIGIELRVTPQASPDYFVLMDVEATSSEFSQGSASVDGIPPTIERTVNSTILVKSGQTFALGGVYRIQDLDTVDGVPWLKDVPFFGTAFRRTQVVKSDEELVFFITPHIVEGSFDAASF